MKYQISPAGSVDLFRIFLFILPFLLLFSCQQEKRSLTEWAFETNNRIQSQPVLNKGILYFGSHNGIFHAINIKTGKQIWQFTTGNSIRSKTAIQDSIIFITSGNNLYALDPNTGTSIWTYQDPDTTNSGILDFWDYHTGGAVMYKDQVFVGFGNGNLYGFDAKSGQKTLNFTSLDSAPIRSTPAIFNNDLYVGDWNGIIYAMDIQSGDTNWTYKTYDVQPYPTFGQINSQLVVNDSLLFFGSRNPELQVLDIRTGKPVWTYVSPEGGWISGDPLISGDTLFIGGSDNHTLFAFHSITGELFWEYLFLFNNFSSPVIKNDQIFITTGDAYAFTGDYFGNGYLYALKRQDGSLINMTHFEGNVFNSPAITEDWIITAGDDGIVRTIRYKNFTHSNIDFPAHGQGPVDSLTVEYDSAKVGIHCSFTMSFPDTVQVIIRAFNGKITRELHTGFLTRGTHTYTWNGRNNQKEEVPEGYYYFETVSGMVVKNRIVRYP